MRGRVAGCRGGGPGSLAVLRASTWCVRATWLLSMLVVGVILAQLPQRLVSSSSLEHLVPTPPIAGRRLLSGNGERSYGLHGEGVLCLVLVVSRSGMGLALWRVWVCPHDVLWFSSGFPLIN
jgi:hypothetical protein